MLEEDLRYPQGSWEPDSRNWPQRRGEVVRLLPPHDFQDRRSECSLLRREFRVVVGARQPLPQGFQVREPEYSLLRPGLQVVVGARQPLPQGFQVREPEYSLLRRGLQVVVGARQPLLVERVAKELELQYEVYFYSGLDCNCTGHYRNS